MKHIFSIITIINTCGCNLDLHFQIIIDKIHLEILQKLINMMIIQIKMFFIVIHKRAYQHIGSADK